MIGITSLIYQCIDSFNKAMIPYLGLVIYLDNIMVCVMNNSNVNINPNKYPMELLHIT